MLRHQTANGTRMHTRVRAQHSAGQAGRSLAAQVADEELDAGSSQPNTRLATSARAWPVSAVAKTCRPSWRKYHQLLTFELHDLER